MEAQFFTELHSKDLEGPWSVLTFPFAGYSAKYNVTWCAPPRFVTDFASVPRWPITYFLFGGKGKKNSVPHDLGYRWNVLSRWQWDNIFCEMGKVYHHSLENQSIPKRVWRWTERFVMTTGVVLGGWASYKNYPGSLDYRKCKVCQWGYGTEACKDCSNFYKQWRSCVKQGYFPNIAEQHIK